MTTLVSNSHLRRQAVWVVVWSILVAGLFTALVWWI